MGPVDSPRPEVAVLRGTVSDWAYAMSALRYSFTFLTNNWRQAAADDASAGLTPETQEP